MHDQLSHTISSLTSRVDTLLDELKLQNDKLSDEIRCQNIIILGMQTQFQDTMSYFASKLQALYNPPDTPTTTISPVASTSMTQHRGDQAK